MFRAKAVSNFLNRFLSSSAVISFCLLTLTIAAVLPPGN